jgi:hypothetical protein
MPAVAEQSATTPLALQYSRKASSNSAAFGPVVIQPERSTSATASISNSLMAGLENGRNEDLIFFSLYLNSVISHLVTRKTARIFQS